MNGEIGRKHLQFLKSSTQRWKRWTSFQRRQFDDNLDAVMDYLVANLAPRERVRLALPDEAHRKVMQATAVVMSSQCLPVQGDNRDAALMTFSVALFCVLGAQMYGIYIHLYNIAGMRPLSGNW